MKSFLKWVESNGSNSGWDRFGDFVGSASWDSVVEAGLGDPTPEEEKAIMKNGLWGRAITKQSIDLLKGKATDASAKKYVIVSRCIDGTDEDEFGTVEEVKNFVKKYMGSEFRRTGNGSFRTDYCNREFQGFTFEDIGM